MNLSGRVVTIGRTRIVCGGKFTSVDAFLRARRLEISKIVILVDEHTGRLCLPLLKEGTVLLNDALVLEIPSGDLNKNIQTATGIWNEMLASKADRKTLLINLGGGVISDLGGFVAAGFKRGISYINIPTTLMGQVDASIGGKTAINFGGVKNQIGFFYTPIAVFIFPEFLKSLPSDQFRSGLAEIIKYALIADPVLWNKIKRMPVRKIEQVPDNLLKEFISKTVAFKNSIVRKDFRDNGVRKVLNFGHTIGHAFESLSRMGERKSLLHGEAIAIGMICEGYLSAMKKGLDFNESEGIKKLLRSVYSHYHFTREDIPILIELMEHDKKNRDGLIDFTFLKSIGSAVINSSCNRKEITESLEYYLKEI